VSHPTPLPPDADLAVVLDDFRQSVVAWGDEGVIVRAFRAGICLMLLSVLDMLIDLLEDFRAGRLPPVLPAEDEGGMPAERATAPPQGPASRRTRAAGNASVMSSRDAGADAACDAPGQIADRGAEPVPRHRVSLRMPPRLAIVGREPAPSETAWLPSRVPRWPKCEIRGQDTCTFACPFRYDIETIKGHGQSKPRSRPRPLQ
jgi:hypothetical protein